MSRSIGASRFIVLFAALAAGAPACRPPEGDARAASPVVAPTITPAIEKADSPSADRPREPQFNLRDNFHCIEPGRAYRSAQLAPETLRRAIEQYHITTVVNLRGSNPHADWYQQERAVCEQAGVKMVDIRLSADQCPSQAELRALCDAFCETRAPLLMHCAAGADRTGAAAAIWRIVANGDSTKRAAGELSIRYGHIKLLNPALDALIDVFEPGRDWIESVYPAWEGCRYERGRGLVTQPRS